MSADQSNEPLKVGFHPPEQCARGRTDCQSLAQIISTEQPHTFVCCGEVLGDSPEPRDQWSFCFRADQDREHCVGTDLRIFVDRRDMSHMAAVLSMGLATVIPPDVGAPEREIDTLPEGDNDPNGNRDLAREIDGS